MLKLSPRYVAVKQVLEQARVHMLWNVPKHVLARHVLGHVIRRVVDSARLSEQPAPICSALQLGYLNSMP